MLILEERKKIKLHSVASEPAFGVKGQPEGILY